MPGLNCPFGFRQRIAYDEDGVFEPQWPGLVKSMMRRALQGLVGLRLLMAFGGWLGCLALASAAPEAGAWQGVVASLDAELPRLLISLDDDQYAVRHAAQERLDSLAADPECQPKVAAAIRRRLTQPGLSLEARETLERLIAPLAKLASAGPPLPAAAEIDRLIPALDDNSYPARIAAAENLADLLGNGRAARDISERLKQHLADPAVGCGARKAMDALWKQARGVWLLGDEKPEALKPVSDQQLQRWLDELALPLPNNERRAHEARVRIENARRELLDLLACDRDLPRVKAALEQRLIVENPFSLINAERGGPKTAIEKRLDAERHGIVHDRLGELFDLTRPAMVAEYWQAGRHTGVQHLLIGIPNHSPNAQRASHFDSINEQTAHCVSGNALSPGDYPVDVFFPHPRQEDAQFHLVNLPTPRRGWRMSTRSRSTKRSGTSW